MDKHTEFDEENDIHKINIVIVKQTISIIKSLKELFMIFFMHITIINQGPLIMIWHMYINVYRLFISTTVFANVKLRFKANHWLKEKQRGGPYIEHLLYFLYCFWKGGGEFIIPLMKRKSLQVNRSSCQCNYPPTYFFGSGIQFFFHSVPLPIFLFTHLGGVIEVYFCVLWNDIKPGKY